MLIEPNDWSPDHNGGYLLNEVMRGHDMVRRGNPTLIQGETCYTFLNKIQKVAYTLNPFVTMVADHLMDKGISVGENSKVNIENLNTINNNIGLAVKDGSKAIFSKINFDSNKFDIVLFNKKQEFLKPSLVIGNLNEIAKKTILQSKDTSLKINNKEYFGNFDDQTINALIY